MTIISKESLWASFENIRTINDIAGRFDGGKLRLMENIDLALSLNFEELSEAIADFEAQDAVGLVGEVVDMWVVLAMLLQTMEAAGFDVEKAMRKVDAANLAKLPRECPKAFPPEAYRTVYNEHHQRFVIKRADGKFLKPVGWTAADLTDCAPTGFFNKQ